MKGLNGLKIGVTDTVNLDKHSKYSVTALQWNGFTKHPVYLWNKTRRVSAKS